MVAAFSSVVIVPSVLQKFVASLSTHGQDTNIGAQFAGSHGSEHSIDKVVGVVPFQLDPFVWTNPFSTTHSRSDATHSQDVLVFCESQVRSHK